MEPPFPGLLEGPPGGKQGAFLLSFEASCQLQHPQRRAEPGPGRGFGVWRWAEARSQLEEGHWSDAR